MSKLDFLGLRIDLERLEESLAERLARIEAEASASDSADDATVAAVERMLVNPRPRTIDGIDWDEDVEDDFAGGTSGIDGAPCTMTWRSHFSELVSRLREEGHERHAAHLARLADVNSLKKPFTAADEAEVIKSILEYLAALKKEVGRDGTPPDPSPESQTPAAKPSDNADGPVPPNAFFWNGSLFEGLQEVPWRLVNVLWSAKNRTLPIDTELGSVVWLDHAEVPGDDQIGGARKKANHFFSQNAIPLAVSKSSRTHVSLKAAKRP
jgi:hypothetical protein